MSDNFPLAARSRKRRKRSLSAGGSRKRRRSRGGLSEVFSPVTAMESARCTATGLIGGMGGGLLNDVIPDATGFGYRLLLNLGASFIVGGVLRAPKMAAGMAGAMGVILYQKLRGGSLQEDYQYADPDALSEYPMFADAEGNPMYLAEDGNMYYLEENVDPYKEAFSLSAANFMNEDQEAFYPSYVNASNY